MKVMFVNYPLLTKEVQGKVVDEKIRYTFHDKKVLIETSMFPSQLEVELQGKDPDSLEQLSEVWDFNSLHDGVIDFPTLETIFHHIPVVDAFIENGELHMKLHQNKGVYQTTDEWVEVKEEPFSVGGSIESAKFEWNTNEDLFDLQKDMKKEELSQACQEDILSGFYYVHGDDVYHFSYDREAQMNLQERYQMFQGDLVEKVSMNAQKGSTALRMEVDKKLFTKIYKEGFNTREKKISRLKDELFLRVDKAKTSEDLSKINW